MRLFSGERYILEAEELRLETVRNHLGVGAGRLFVSHSRGGWTGRK